MARSRPSITWDHNGRAKERKTREVPCPGPPGYKPRKCQGRWTDEYGSSHWCPECQYGNGKKIVVEYFRRPEYDAPEPGSLDPMPLTERIGVALSGYGEDTNG